MICDGTPDISGVLFFAYSKTARFTGKKSKDKKNKEEP